MISATAHVIRTRREFKQKLVDETVARVRNVGNVGRSNRRILAIDEVSAPVLIGTLDVVILERSRVRNERVDCIGKIRIENVDLDVFLVLAKVPKVPANVIPDRQHLVTLTETALRSLEPKGYRHAAVDV